MGELQSGSDNERIDEICHLTRVAISETENEDDLQPEILRHLEECEKCRSFREQNKKMLDALSQLSPGFLSKNGIGDLRILLWKKSENAKLLHLQAPLLTGGCSVMSDWLLRVLFCL